MFNKYLVVVGGIWRDLDQIKYKKKHQKQLPQLFLIGLNSK